MRRHATIGNLMVLMVICGVGFAGLSRPSALANELIFAASAIALASAAVAAINRQRGEREHWVCFAVFGWAYLLLSLTPHGERRLPTARWLDNARPWLVRPSSEAADQADVLMWTTGASPPSAASQNWVNLTLRSTAASPSNYIFVSDIARPYENYYLGIGHSFLAVLVGWLSALTRGVIAGFAAVYSRRRQASSPSSANLDADSGTEAEGGAVAEAS